jgi:hypothetical protein
VVRIHLGVPDIKGLDDRVQNQKAPAVPFDDSEPTTGVRTRPGLFDTLAAIDAAVVAGDVARARALIAAAARGLEPGQQLGSARAPAKP